MKKKIAKYYWRFLFYSRYSMNFLKFNEILKKHPDNLEKHVVNKVRILKKIKEIFQKVAKSGSRFENSIG